MTLTVLYDWYVALGIWLIGRLGAYALRSSSRRSDVGFMGCEQRGIHFRVHGALRSLHTIVVGDREGALLCLVPLVQARRSSSIY